MRAVTLLWLLESSTSHSHVESIIAQQMNSPKPKLAKEAQEAFGVLWRLTGNYHVQIISNTTKLMREVRRQSLAWFAIEGAIDDHA